MQRSKGGMQGRGVKIKPSLPAVKPPPEKSATEKPLAGRVFYLDIPSKLISEKLEKDIKDLGGTIEGFLSKEISFLITSKKEAKCARSLKYSSSIPSPEPVRNAGNGIARAGGRRDGNQEKDSNKKPEKDDISRGKSLLKKVIKEQEILPKNSILANALNWGVRILHVDEAKIYIDQKKKCLKLGKEPESATKPVVKPPARRKPKAQKLKSPYIKVEDSSGLYRPLYLVLPLFRSFQSPPTKSCQSVDKKAATANKAPETKQGLNKTWHGQDGGNNSNCKAREQKKRGYCECCLQKYEDLEAHLVGPQHKNFSQGPYYQDVDNLISMFDFDFVDWSRCKQEDKSSPLLTPAEIMKPEGEEILKAPHPISSQNTLVANQEPANVEQIEVDSPRAAAACPSNNPIPCPEPMDSTPCPVPSLLHPPCSPDFDNDIPPWSPVLIPETPMSPVPEGEPLCDEQDSLNTEWMPHRVIPDPLRSLGLPLLIPETPISPVPEGDPSCNEDLRAGVIPDPVKPSGLPLLIPYSPISPVPEGEPFCHEDHMQEDAPQGVNPDPLNPQGLPFLNAYSPISPAPEGEPFSNEDHMQEDALTPENRTQGVIHNPFKPLGPPLLIREVPMSPNPAGEVFCCEDNKQDTLTAEGRSQRLILSPCLPLLIPESISPIPAGKTFGNEDHMQEEDALTPEDMRAAVIPDHPLKTTRCPTSSSEPDRGCPSKRIKLDNSLVSETLTFNSAIADRLISPALALETAQKHTETVCVLNPPYSLSGRSPSSSPSKPHRKVKTHRERRPETPQTLPVCKVSVPVEHCDLSSSTEALLALFESSDTEAEFCGFSGRSESWSCSSDSWEVLPSSQDGLLWCLFSQTSSSAATFYGF